MSAEDRNGSQQMDTEVNWRTDPSWWSANRAEKAIVGPYELVAFDLPAHKDFLPEIGWEVFGGPARQDQLATGTAQTFDQAKADAEAAWKSIAGGEA